jgi:putative ABC transport system substrate-binding protein
MKTWLLLFLIALVTAATAGFALAQQPAKIPRIGYLNTHLRQSTSLASDGPRGLMDPFRDGLRELGYTDGQNIMIDTRIGEESELRYLAAELVRLKVDVIVAQPAAIAAAIGATATIPIVAVFPGDPVASGNVASLDRPGGNITGISGLTFGLGGKWLELIKETVPSAKRVAVFWNRPGDIRFPLWKSVESAARSLDVDVRWEQAGFPNNHLFDQRLRSASLRLGADAFIVLPGVVGRNIEAIAEFGLRNRIPGIFWRTDLAMDGSEGLMAYGVNRFEQSRRTAYLVDKILKGAKPAELPIEQPKKFELVINLKTAKEIGITIPSRVLAWADQVIK